MSKTTKKKHVTREVTDELLLPKNGQKIVKILNGRGNNLHEATDEDGNVFLVSMPTKYRRTVWVKRGSYVIVESIAEGDKVQGEIVHVLLPDNIAYIAENGAWPAAFESVANSSASKKSDQIIDDDMLPPSGSDDFDSSDNDDDNSEGGEGDSDPEAHIEVCNPNRQRGLFAVESGVALADTPNGDGRIDDVSSLQSAAASRTKSEIG